MSVGDEDRVDPVSGGPFQQAGHRRISRVDEQPEPVVVDEVATARLSRRRPCPTAAENRQPHHPKDAKGRTCTWPAYRRDVSGPGALRRRATRLEGRARPPLRWAGPDADRAA